MIYQRLRGAIGRRLKVGVADGINSRKNLQRRLLACIIWVKDSVRIKYGRMSEEIGRGRRLEKL